MDPKAHCRFCGVEIDPAAATRYEVDPEEAVASGPTEGWANIYPPTSEVLLGLCEECEHSVKENQHERGQLEYKRNRFNKMILWLLVGFIGTLTLAAILFDYLL